MVSVQVYLHLHRLNYWTRKLNIACKEKKLGAITGVKTNILTWKPRNKTWPMFSFCFWNYLLCLQKHTYLISLFYLWKRGEQGKGKIKTTWSILSVKQREQINVCFKTKPVTQHQVVMTNMSLAFIISMSQEFVYSSSRQVCFSGDKVLWWEIMFWKLFQRKGDD